MNGRKWVFSPSSLVVIAARSLETAKCTSARCPNDSSGSRPAVGQRVAVLAVLLDRLVQRLGEVGLQLHRRHREPVDEEHQVDAALVGGGEVHLPHHPHPHRRVVRVRRLVQRRLGPELRHLQPAAADVLHPVAQDVQRAAAVLQRLVQRRGQHVEELRRRPGRLQRLLVRRRLGLLQPREQVLGKQRPLPVVAGVVRRVQPAVGREVLADLGLEDDLVVVGHHATSRTSICPVTAAVISAAPPLPREFDEPLRLGDQRVDLRGLLVEVRSDPALLL